MAAMDDTGGAAVQRRLARTRQGRVAYLECGEGPPLVLLHSNGCSSWEFEHNFQRLSRDFRVLAWDMPGHGESEGIAGHMDIAFYADALAAWLEALDLEGVLLLGTSIGGTIAAAYCARAQHRAAALLLVETPWRPEAAWRANWAQVERIFAVPTQTREQIAPRFRNVDAALLERWNIDRNKAGGGRMVDAMNAIAEFDLLDVLPRIAVPTLLVFGDKGPVLDAMPRYRQSLPKAPVVVLQDCGHFPMIDDPAAFDAAVAGFAHSVAGR